MKKADYKLALLVRDKNPHSDNYGREGYAVGVKNSGNGPLIEIETRKTKTREAQKFYSRPDDVECISPSHILRAVRQEKRAQQADQFGEKFVSKAVARLYVIFGGNIENYKRDEAKGETRTTRMKRAIRKFQRRREEIRKLRRAPGDAAA